DRRHKLTEYPVPSIPIPAKSSGLLLDIGCGWGRWMVAAAKKGFRPVGIDIKLESALASRDVMRDLGIAGHVVVADLEFLPFERGVFDTAWSFSVIQHVHRKKATACLDGIVRCLKPVGFSTLEFPNKKGLWNTLVQRRRSEEEDDPESWCVRYYSIRELEELMKSRFGNFRYQAHCFFGLGILPQDLKWIPWRYSPIILASLALTAASRVLFPLRWIAASIYCYAAKGAGTITDLNRSCAFTPSTSSTEPSQNLAILPILRCPATLTPLQIHATGQWLVSPSAGLAYPVVDGIPVLLRERAV